MPPIPNCFRSGAISAHCQWQCTAPSYLQYMALPYLLWWLTSCINMIRHRLPRSKGASVRAFQDETSTSICGLRNCPPNVIDHHLIYWGPEKAEEGGIHPFFPMLYCLNSFHLFLPLDWNSHCWLAWFSGIWTWTNYTPGFPRSPVCKCRFWNFSISITGWVNSS